MTEMNNKIELFEWNEETYARMRRENDELEKSKRETLEEKEYSLRIFCLIRGEQLRREELEGRWKNIFVNHEFEDEYYEWPADSSSEYREDIEIARNTQTLYGKSTVEEGTERRDCEG